MASLQRTLKSYEKKVGAKGLLSASQGFHFFLIGITKSVAKFLKKHKKFTNDAQMNQHLKTNLATRCPPDFKKKKKISKNFSQQQGTILLTNQPTI